MYEYPGTAVVSGDGAPQDEASDGVRKMLEIAVGSNVDHAVC